ncbi:hypothetical protein [Polyangium sp. 15x6]|uniref:hypothetical protein n=1 Tax=Polyangium sp. 15x6 TaxID=3042687 RepID=UPI00249C7F23|nr:hypothetical protein [Polyangium sp. 15x6]MDI3285391.1 hypothetical protein [Polyangium sp. 15x6]
MDRNDRRGKTFSTVDFTRGKIPCMTFETSRLLVRPFEGLGMHRIGDRVRATLPHVALALERGEAEAAPWWPDALVSP